MNSRLGDHYYWSRTGAWNVELGGVMDQFVYMLCCLFVVNTYEVMRVNVSNSL
jgi:hypothetical protein